MVGAVCFLGKSKWECVALATREREEFQKDSILLMGESRVTFSPDKMFI